MHKDNHNPKYTFFSKSAILTLKVFYNSHFSCVEPCMQQQSNEMSHRWNIFTGSGIVD